jgi:diketogulonate reductase-like aldo/keto reductase
MTLFPIDHSDRKELGNTREYIPAIGIGTWDIKNYSLAEKALVEAVGLGLNLIDTAEMYHSGKAEELVGRVSKTVGRSNIFIVTKLMPDKFIDEYTAEKAMISSLKRLDVGSVDLLLIHWPNIAIPIKKQVAILENLAEKGYTRHIGVSNFSENQLLEAIESLKNIAL